MAGSDLFGYATQPKASTRPAGQFGRPRRLTRADYIMPTGWTPKRLAANTRRSLNAARAKLERLAAPWEDIDNTVQSNLARLLAEFDEFERSIEDSVTWLLERADYDD